MFHIGAQIDSGILHGDTETNSHALRILVTNEDPQMWRLMASDNGLPA
jgi:hypothetical protein